MKEYNDIRSEYLGWKSANPDKDYDLATYAKLMDEYAQTPGERGQAYNDGVIKQLNAGIDRFFAPVGEAIAPVGAAIDNAVTEMGYNSKGAAESGLKELPRAAAEFIPFAGWAGKASRLAKIGQLGAQVAGSASAGANAYSDTDSVAAGLIGAAGLPATAKAAQVGERIAAKYLTRGTAEALAKSVPNPTKEALGVFVGGNTGAGVAGELQRQAMISATGEGDRNPFTAENVVSNIVGTLPEVVAKTGPELLSGRGAREVNEMRADKVQTYLDTLEQRQEQKGFENIQDELGSTQIDAPYKDELIGKAVVNKNNDFIESPAEQSIRTVMEQYDRFGEVRIYRDEIAQQADSLASEFRRTATEVNPRFTDFADTETPLVQASQLVAKPMIELSDPQQLAQFIKDVNQTIRDQYDVSQAIEMTNAKDIQRAKNLRKTLGVGADIEETPEPLIRKEFNAFSPDALEGLQKEGRVPRITPEFLKERFEHHFENGITFSNQEAYFGMVQSVKNLLIDMAQQANRQKSFEIQRRAELQSTAGRQTPEQRAEIYVTNLKQLPEDLQKRVFEMRAKWGESENKYGAERDQIGHHEDLLNQAVANWDKASGMTTISFKTYIPGGYIDQSGTKRSYKTVERVLPIEEAVLFEPKRRLVGKKAKTERQAVSLEALTEEGAAQERQRMMNRADIEMDDTKEMLVRDDSVGVEGGKVTDTTKVNVGVDSKPINEQGSDSLTERDSKADPETKVREALDLIRTQGTTAKVWGNYIQIFADSRGRILKPDEKRALFPLAVDALTGDKQALLRFGKAKLGRDVSSMEAGQYLRDYWGKNNEFKNAFFEKLRQDAGVEKREGVASAVYDEIDKKYFLDSQAEELNAGIKSHFERHFRNAGLSPELVDHLTATSLRGASLFGKSNVEFTDLKFTDPVSLQTYAEKISENLTVLGMYGRGHVNAAGKFVNPIIAIALDHKVKNKDYQGMANFHVISTAIHERIHDVEHKARGALLSSNADVKARGQAYQNMWNYVNSLSKDDMFGMLQNLVDVVLPHKMTRNHANALLPKIAGYIEYGTSKPSEFIARYGELYFLGLASGGTKVDDVVQAMRWEAPDVQNFMRAVYRDVSTFTEGLAQLVENPIYRQMAGLKALDGNSTKQVEAIRNMASWMDKLVRPDVELLKAQKTTAEVMSFLETGAIKALSDKQPPNVPPTSPIKTAHDFLASDGEAEPSKMPWWNKTFMPFVQAAARTGNKMAMQVASTLVDNTHVKIRLNHQMMEPLMVRDASGKKIVDPTGLVVQVYKSDTYEPSRSHRAVNNLARKMQELGQIDPQTGQPQRLNVNVKPDPVTGRMDTVFDQLVALNPELSRTLASEMSILNPKERGQVIGAMNQMLEVYRNAGEVLWKAQVDHTGVRATRLLQVLRPGDANDALSRGMLLMNGIANNDMTAVNQAVNGLDTKIAQTLIAFGTGVNEPLKALRDMLDKRPFFMSEQRPGTHIVRSVDSQGNTQIHGADSQKHAQTIIAELKKRGNTNFRVIDKQAEYGDFAMQLPEQYAEKFANMEAQSLQRAMDRLKTQFPPALVDALAQEFKPGAEIMKHVTTKGVQKNLTERKLVGGREDLDYIRVMKDYVSSLATSIANRSTKGRIGVFLEDSTMAQVPDFKPFALTQLENTLRPGNQTVNQLRTMMSSYYLGANFGSMVIEGTQNFVTLIPHLIKNGDGVIKAYGRLGKAITQLAGMKEGAEFNAAVRRGADPQAKPEDQLAHWYRRFKDENPEGSNAFDDLEINEDKTSIISGRNRHGNFDDVSTTKIAVNGVYQLSKFMMKFYGKISNWNTKAAFIAAFNQAQEAGITGAQAYEYAKQAVYTTSFGGGKANQPGYVAKFAKVTPLIGLVHTLQQYGMGMSSMMGTYAKDAIMGRKDLSPEQRKQAVKAFGTLFTTQMALSGALGIPFAGAAMAILEKQFGVQANAAVREGLAQLAGDDEELGFMLGDAAMNGVASQVLGMDVSSRTGVGNLVGTSSYSGFNLKDLLGPAPSMVENLFSASQNAIAGEPVKTVQSLMPQTFKNALSMYDSYSKFGQVQFMDKSNNKIMEPSVMESLLYSIGFKPTKLRQYQSANAMQMTANEITSREKSKELDKLAIALLQEDSAPLIEYVQEKRADDPGLDPRGIVTSVIDKAIDMSTPRDLLANRGADGKIIRATMGQPLNRQSEVQRLEMKEAALAKLGYPFGIRPASRKERLRAMKIDELVGQGMTRAEAVRAVDVMSYRQAALASQWDGGVQMMGDGVGL